MKTISNTLTNTHSFRQMSLSSLNWWLMISRETKTSIKKKKCDKIMSSKLWKLSIWQLWAIREQWYRGMRLKENKSLLVRGPYNSKNRTIRLDVKSQRKIQSIKENLKPRASCFQEKTSRSMKSLLKTQRGLLILTVNFVVRKVAGNPWFHQKQTQYSKLKQWITL